MTEKRDKNASNKKVQILEPGERSVIKLLPFEIGKSLLRISLAQFPLTLLSLDLLAFVGEKYVSISNEEKVQTLLDSVHEKVEVLEKGHRGLKDCLPTNFVYQEVAQKRLSLISSLDTEDDLKLSGALIALCGVIDGRNPKDRYLLKALTDIYPNELRLFLLIHKKRNEMQNRKDNFSLDERRDAQSEQNLIEAISVEFFSEGEQLLNLYDFSYILSRIHSFGLTEAKNTGVISYNYKQKVYPPQLTPIGDYFVSLLAEVGIK